MALGPEASQERQLRAVKEAWERQLKQVKLGESQIRAQSLEELQQSLETINDAIKHPDQFPTVTITATLGSGLASTETTAEVGILPLLLERKTLILERIRLLRGEEKIAGLRDLVAQVPDDSVRSELEEQLKSLEAESEKLLQQEKEVAEKQEDLPDVEWIVKERESRVRMWQTLLARESVATIIGAFLLVVFVIAYLIAMFVGVETTQIVDSAFLLVLGYFFGQTVSRAQSEP
jgi:hypothetical protein